MAEQDQRIKAQHSMIWMVKHLREHGRQQYNLELGNKFIARPELHFNGFPTFASQKHRS